MSTSRGGARSADPSRRQAGAQPPVSRADLEARLRSLREQTKDPRAGLFGPSSKVWEVNREALIFVGSGRAALLQLAHPYVADAIDRFSDTRTDPLGRFHRTFVNVFAMVYGDLESAFRAARRVHGVHERITGELSEALAGWPAGHRYRANEPEALLWVHASLWETSVTLFELLVRRLDAAEKERYYVETRRFAGLFGIPEDLLPPHWEAFLDYNRAMWRRLEAGAAARRIAADLFRPPPRGWGPALRWLEIMTAGSLPEELRRDFGLSFGAARRRVFRLSVGVLRGTRPLWPRRLRFVPPYPPALRRAAGDPRRDRIGEWLLRLWLGPEAKRGTAAQETSTPRVT